MKGRKRERGGQIIVVTAIIITIIVLSIAYMISEAVNLRQRIRYEPYKEVVENLESSFRAALAATLANMTEQVDVGEDIAEARTVAYNYLSKWKAAAMRAYADLGLELDFTTPDESGAYLLQEGKTLDHDLGGGIHYQEYIVPWNLYNLSQLYWDYSTGCSAIYATLYINLTEYGFYGWKRDIVVTANATVNPGTFEAEIGRSPADIVLVLDSSYSMFFLPYSSEDYKNDYTMRLTGSIGPSPGWQTVGTIDFGEIPTQFVAILTWSGSEPGFQMANGSYNEYLVITYSLGGVEYTEALPAIEDAYVRSRYPDNNYGTGQTLQASGYRYDLYRTWLKFDISSIPSGATIEGAQLNIYVRSNSARKYSLKHSNTCSWGETTITWTINQQISFSSTCSATAPSQKGWMSWDVTSDVQKDHGEQFISWAIMDHNENSNFYTYIVTHSRESTGFPGYNVLISSSIGQEKFVYSTGDGTPIAPWPNPTQNLFGRTNMWNYGKNGKWMIQLQNPGSGYANYDILVQTRKLDCVRNTATTFLRLLNPDLDRLAIVQYGPGSDRGGVYYYYANMISDGFYYLSNDFQSALNDINWRDPDGSNDDIGYGFEVIGSPPTKYFGGCTPLGAGIEVGAKLFNGTYGVGTKYSAREGSKRIMIIISDGKENIRPNPPVQVPPGGPGVYYEPTYYSIESDLTGDAYSDRGVITYTIGYGEDVNEDCLKELARLGHGQYYRAANITELEEILAGLAYQLNDKLTFDFTLTQEQGIAVNALTGSSLKVFLVDSSGQRHEADLDSFFYRGGGNFEVTLSLAGWQTPEAVDVVVTDPRGILVRLQMPLWIWRAG